MNAGRLLVTAVVLTSILVGTAASADRKPFEQLVAETTTIFVSFRDLGAAKKWLETSPVSEVWKSREVQEFWKEMLSQIEAETADKEAFREASKLLESFNGEVALAVGDLSKLDLRDKTTEPPILLLADVSATAEKARESIKRLVQMVRDKANLRVSESTFRDVKIQSFAPREEEEGKGQRFHFAEAGGLMALGFSRQMLQDALANRSEAAVKPLAESTEFKSLRERFGKDAALSIYANTSGMVQLLPKLISTVEEPEAQQVAMFLPGVLGLLGLANMKSIWISTTLGKEDISSTYFFSLGGPPRGVMKILGVKQQALKFPNSVPDDVASATLVRYNPEAVWELVEGVVKLAGNFMPLAGGPDEEGGPQDPIARVESQLGIKFKQDIFGTLSGQLVFYDRLPASTQAQDAVGNIAFLLELKDRDKLQASLDKVLGLAPFLKKGDYLGRPIYGLADGQEFESGDDTGDGDDAAGEIKSDGSDAGPFALAITESNLVMGIPRAQAEEAIRRVGKEVKSVNDSAGFKAVASQFPATSTAISYQSAESFRKAIEMLQELFAMTTDSAATVVPEEGNETEPALPEPGEPSAQTKRLLSKFPGAALLSKPIAGFIGWSFSEERGLGAMSRIVFKRK